SITFVCLFACGGHWCYQSQKYKQPSCEEPRRWYLINNTCKESKQSPINIVTKNVIYDDSLKPLNFEGYDVQGSSKWNIENNGHTVKATFSTAPKIGGGGLKRKYKAIELHFHWGDQDIHYLPGSEHSIDGEKTAMELHLVHIREDLPDITEAKKNENGIAVLAFFIEVGDENKKYAPLINELDNIKYKGYVAQMDALPLFSLLPNEEDLARYYRYIGSLTTPDCHEGVIWTVFEKPVALSLAQVSQFSMVYFGGKNSTHMVENFRPVQPLNDRSIYWSGASLPQPSARVLMLLSVLTYILSSL
ncbi:CAH4 anhydrase, partial [Nothoprocta ornata]|nr:CAH4 anhydrase [Nothoprocta pentlandii]NWX97886.1 CAH4 anhydrase [Nothoprocta ornata]